MRVNTSSNVCNEDEDASLERNRVEREGHSDILVIKDLAKSYGPVKAVDNITFGAQEESCFGLLGYCDKLNHLKAKRMSILSREHRKTHTLIAYAHHFDGEETLVLFASTRGVKENHTCETVEDIATELSFYHYIDRKFEGCTVEETRENCRRLWLF
ncbi:unnamed protein product [Orchesella dallaii]|uniref:Uncharacterized protein n=1 Tax=Orchesella dallaii TaxID=48710 RepID=A0ABP1QD82_9HEXA